MQNFGPVLGIETSCDETAAAVVCRDRSGKPRILSNIILSQIEEHSEFGGVVPEIAARAHLSALDRIIKAALQDADLSLEEISGIGVTSGPGLIGGLIVGLMTAKALSASNTIPYLGINHLEGHALTARLTDDLTFPYLLLLVSGGHSQILKIENLGQYKRIASTIDDAVGELFDKTAKLLDLGFPGGPMVEKAAKLGDPKRFQFTKPLRGQSTLNMSFSGLKTAVRNEAGKHTPLTDQTISDICAGMQKTVADFLAERCDQTITQHGQDTKTLVVAGGVAANGEIRNALEKTAETHGMRLIAPPLKLCTDNAAMIAWAALERFERGKVSSLDLSPRSRWPLDESAETMLGSGRKGAKV
ncbi:MAG: tRNA (adenosine(37)-N6)-threonylcarbamoyltransferase complex transferase subunit TsaD [Rhizobiaceae bacterium]|nr:tRNA (adenosine(37)-N6)-threonylcarbamoyltransferase complex transferase subunit TsaD [Rhizobiaceae bacterium]